MLHGRSFRSLDCGGWVREYLRAHVLLLQEKKSPKTGVCGVCDVCLQFIIIIIVIVIIIIIIGIILILPGSVFQVNADDKEHELELKAEGSCDWQLESLCAQGVM